MPTSSAANSPLSVPTQVRGACPHDCPDTCALLTTIENGVATRVQGNPAHPHTDGVLCAKVSKYTERSYHPERVLTPLKRTGAKGAGQFVPVTWDEALSEIAAHLNQLLAQGLAMNDAVYEGARRRLRPVMMTATIAALGLVPLLFATGPGSEIQKPLAIVVIGGLISSTVLTLFLLPILYERFGVARAQRDIA